jgi:hypothetical protein
VVSSFNLYLPDPNAQDTDRSIIAAKAQLGALRREADVSDLDAFGADFEL